MRHKSSIISANFDLVGCEGKTQSIQFNECQAVSDIVNVQSLAKASGGRFQHDDFIQAQFQMLKLFKFKLHLGSPYENPAHFLAILAKYPSKKTQARLAKIQIIIDFALTLPSLLLIAPEILYLACFLMIFESVLSECDMEMVMRCMHDGSIVRQVRRQIETRLSEMGNFCQTQKT